MTTIREIIDDSELTTDACPQPPRDATPVIEEPENIEKSQNVETESSIPKTYVKYPRKQPKERIQKSTPIANIINIANCNGVQIGKSVTYNIQRSPSRFDEKKGSYIKTEAVNKLLNSSISVTREHIMFISSHVGEGWRDIGRLLNYSEGQTYQFEENHMLKGIKEVVYQLLLDWIQNEPDKATLGRLTDVLWNSKQEEVVFMLTKKQFS